MWLTKFKIALVEKNSDNLDKLIDNVPTLETKEEMQEAIYLLAEAKKVVEALKQETSLSMKKIKKNIEFLESTQAPRINRLDIKS